MPPRKDENKKERKPRESKDFAAFLIVLPMVDNDVTKAQAIVKAMRDRKVF